MISLQPSDLHAEFVDEQLRVTCDRIAEALARVKRAPSRDEEARWLAACAEREARADALAGPGWPISRLGLTQTEHRALWVLIAQELCPSARLNLRGLATEDDVDVSLDVLRRVLYGSRRAQHAWRELAVGGRLRTTCLIGAHEGDGMPAHRIAFRIAPRVLALVHGELGVDDELTGIVVPDPRAIRTMNELVINPHVRDQVCAALHRTDGFTIVNGLGGSGRRSLLVAAAHEIGVEVLTIDARRISPERQAADRQLRVIARECELLERAPLLLNLDALAGTAEIDERLDLVQKTFTGRASSRRPRDRWLASGPRRRS